MPSIFAAAAGAAQAQTPPERPWTLQEALGASAALKVSGSVRGRYETIDGQPRPGFAVSDQLWTLRTRLAAEYDFGAVRVGGEVFDSRAFGAERGSPVSTNEVNALEPVQAYVAADFDVADVKTSAQLGRFTLNLGSRRLVAADDFRNTTNGYTGLKVDGVWPGGATASLIYVLPQARMPDDFAALVDNEAALDEETGDLVLYGGIVTVPAGVARAAVQFSYFGFVEQDQRDLATRDRDLDTFGARYFRDPRTGALDFDVEAFAQTGSISVSTAPRAAPQDVSAWYVRAEVGYRWDRPWKPRLAIEYDYATGDEPGGQFERFDTLFGMRRSEIAPSGLYNAVGRANIASPGVRLEVEPNARTDVFVTWRPMWLASGTDAFSTSGVRDATGRSGDFAGNQIDARWRTWIVPQALRFETNLVYLDKGDFLKRAPNAPRGGDTLYSEVSVTWSF